MVPMKPKSRKSAGRPPKRNAMKNAISVKLPSIAFARLKEVGASRRLPVATLVRNQLLDWLDELE